METALATTICPLHSEAGPLLRRWLTTRGDLDLALATDPRLPLIVQRALVAGAVDQGVRCTELGHPALQPKGRPAPSPASPARDEQAAAALALVETLQLAEESGAGRVVLYPWTLPLHTSIEELARQFALGADPQVSTLVSQRQGIVATSMDGIRRTLDQTLPRAEAAGTVIGLCLSSVWPHQVPNSEEVFALSEEFAGAPLGTVRASDWEHAAQAAFEAPPPPATSGPYRFLRLADACGLTVGLPLGCGEAQWQQCLRDAGEPPSGAVLALDEHTSPAELTLSLELLFERDAHPLAYTAQ